MVEPRDLRQRRKLFDLSDLVSRNEAGVKPLGQRTAKRRSFVRFWESAEGSQKQRIDELLRRFGRDRKFRQNTLMRRPRQRHGQRAIG